VTSGDREGERLTALGGLAALSLDALSSVAYGPEAILVVLVTAGSASLRYSLPITVAIVVLLAALVISYRQVIAAFPNGGGAYAVSQRHLGTVPSLVAAASLIVDYVLNAAVGVSAGVEALTAAFPGLYGARVGICLVALIPEVEPAKPWEWLLHNQRGFLLAGAIRRSTRNVVLCRLRYRLEALVPPPVPATTQSGPPGGGGA
jgi:amino acid transporter